MSVDRLMDENNVVHPYTGYYLAIKRNKTLTLAITWINLEDKLNERSQSPKDKYYIIPLM